MRYLTTLSVWTTTLKRALLLTWATRTCRCCGRYRQPLLPATAGGLFELLPRRSPDHGGGLHTYVVWDHRPYWLKGFFLPLSKLWQPGSNKSLSCSCRLHQKRHTVAAYSIYTVSQATTYHYKESAKNQTLSPSSNEYQGQSLLPTQNNFQKKKRKDSSLNLPWEPIHWWHTGGGRGRRRPPPAPEEPPKRSAETTAPLPTWEDTFCPCLTLSAHCCPF